MCGELLNKIEFLFLHAPLKLSIARNRRELGVMKSTVKMDIDSVNIWS